MCIYVPKRSLSHFPPLLAQMVLRSPPPSALTPPSPCMHEQAARHVVRHFEHSLLSSKEKVFIHYSTLLLSRAQNLG